MSAEQESQVEPAGRHSGRTAIVSGGATGIGRAVAERLAREGAQVVTFDLSEPVPGVGRGLTCDISDPDAVRRAADDVRAREGHPDIVVHCAAYQPVLPFAELTDEQWRRSFAVNVDGAFYLTRQFLPAMRRSGWGRVVLVTSSSFVTPPPGMAHYVATKGALIGFARALATEVGPEGVTVNALAPGLTATENALANVPEAHFALVQSRQALSRRGLPEDQAAAVSFLVSDDASIMTGQTMLVDGGEGRI